MQLNNAIPSNLVKHVNEIKDEEKVKNNVDVDNQQTESNVFIIDTEQYQNVPPIEINNNYETVDLSQYIE